MRGCNVIGLDERLERNLPIAGEVEPLPPSIAHLFDLKWIQPRGYRIEKLLQRFAIRIEVDKDVTAPAANPRPELRRI